MIKPVGKFILAQKIEKDDAKTTTSGLFVASDFDDSQPTAKVVNVGDGYHSPSGEWVGLNIQPGDKVVYIEGNSRKFEHDEQEYIFLHFDSIIAIIKD